MKKWSISSLFDMAQRVVQIFGEPMRAKFDETLLNVIISKHGTKWPKLLLRQLKENDMPIASIFDEKLPSFIVVRHEKKT